MTVPSYPGVPPLLQPSGPVNFVIQALRGDALSILREVTREPWGIYDEEGELVIEADNITQFAYRRDWKVSDFPIEGGNFNSYNKTASPYELRLTLTKGGSTVERSNFLAALEALSASTQLVTVVSPEISYTNVNLTGLAYDRSATAGAKLLSVDVAIRQIRVATRAARTSTRSTDTQQNGSVQPVEPTSAQSAAATGAN